MEERHLHWGILTLLFVYLALFWILHPIVKFLLARYYVPGASELAHTA